MKPILARVSEPELQYATDEDTWGPDPLARRYDFAADPVAYATNQMALAKIHRDRLIKKFVKDGQSWAKARQGYELTLALQQRSLSMMANWIGGAYVYRDKKGDPKDRAPIEVVPAKAQRAALKFVMENAFEDAAFGLTPEMLTYMTSDKWWDEGRSMMEDSTWPVHERIMGIQASVLTAILNPTTVGRVYANEYYTPANVDMITLPELLETLNKEIWSEITNPKPEGSSARKPAISSLRRNLQREYVERLIDLSMPDQWSSTAQKPISNLSLYTLRNMQDQLKDLMEKSGTKFDAYTRAHLSEIKLRIDKALDAVYIYNASNSGGMGPQIIIMGGKDGEPPSAAAN